MLCDLERDAGRHAVDRPLELLVLEGEDVAAGVADEVVMVVLVGARQVRLVARDALADLDARQELEALELVEDAVDARAADPAFAARKRLLDLLGRERARLLGEQVDDRLPGSAAAKAGLGETVGGRLRPGGPGTRRLRGRLGHRALGQRTCDGRGIERAGQRSQGANAAPMRNRQLHEALAAFAEEAAWQLASDAQDGHELGFEVVESRKGRGARDGGVLYCYRPLTGDFIDRRESVVAQLPSYAPAVHALRATHGLADYLAAHVARGAVPHDPRARAELGLRAFLGRVFCDQSEFVLDPARFAAAYAELEGVVTAGVTETVVVAPVHGLELESAEVAMGGGLVLVRGEALEDAPEDAVWPRGAKLPSHASVLAVLRWESAVGASATLQPAEDELRRLLTALRLFDEAPVAIGPSAWARAAGGPWHALALGLEGAVPPEDAMTVQIAAEEEDELRAFCSLVSRRMPRAGALAWALRRFELGCSRPTPVEALTDHLLALRALLEPEGPGSGLLCARVAVLCTEAPGRPAHLARLQRTLALERAVVTSLGLPDADDLARLVFELGADCRAILRDVLCGHLEPELLRTADRLLGAATVEAP